MYSTSQRTPAARSESTWRLTKMPYTGRSASGHMFVTTRTSAPGSRCAKSTFTSRLHGPPSARLDAVPALAARDLDEAEPDERPLDLLTRAEVLVPVPQRVVGVEQSPLPLRILGERQLPVVRLHGRQPPDDLRRGPRVTVGREQGPDER